MPIKWKEKNKSLNPKIILDKIDSIKTVQQDGNVSFEMFTIEGVRAALYTMVDFGIDLSNQTKTNILHSAINSAAKNNALSKTEFLKELNNELKKYNSTREKDYYLLTSISIAAPSPIRVINLLNCRITILPGNYPKKYDSRSLLEKQWMQDNEHTPRSYRKVIIKSKAKLSHEAVHLALKALDLLRAVMCLFANSGQSISFGSSIQQKPINKIMLGGLHTLHNEDGKLAEEYFWYEPSYQPQKAHTISIDKIDRYTSNCRKSLTKLSASPFSEKLQNALIRYVRAFDESDKNSTILKTWAAMESLAAFNESNCDAVSKRCSFLFENRQYHKQILEHLREYRNSTVHAGEYIEEAATLCYQIQFYFHHLIIFYIFNSKYFKTLDEANTFLDLPSDLTTLNHQKKKIEKAIKFIIKN